MFSAILGKFSECAGGAGQVGGVEEDGGWIVEGNFEVAESNWSLKKDSPPLALDDKHLAKNSGRFSTS